jgi:S-adenosylmethionine synthetase
LELVERKGLGHPDTICDALAEGLSRELCRYYLEHFGQIFHHNVDKALLSAGRSRPALGGGEMLGPINVVFGGRATLSVVGEAVPVRELSEQVARTWFSRHVPGLDWNRYLRVQCEIHPSSGELTQLFERGHAPLANDTSFGVGFAPLSPLEQLVLDAEEQLNTADFRSAHPEAGTDLKISACGRATELRVTVARAFIGDRLSCADDYFAAKALTRSHVERLARERGLQAEVSVNVADTLEPESWYLTVIGTSAESGDDGEVGRGNRANGLITPHRPMSLEALAGKNPISHVGKLYNVLARNLAGDLVNGLSEVLAARCYLSSQIGRCIDDPECVELEIQTRDGRPVSDVSEAIAEITHQHLGGFAALSERLVEGLERLF